MADNAYYGTFSDYSAGALIFVSAFKFHFMSIQKTGWFSSTHHEFKRDDLEITFQVNFTNGLIYSSLLPATATSKGISYIEDIGKAHPYLQAREPFSIFDIDVFEVVNSHQWQGQTPFEIFRKDGQGRAFYTEPARWEIATVDRRTGKRIAPVMGHDTKDHMFTITSRLNIFLNHVKTLLEPWQEQLREHAKEGWRSCAELPDGQGRAWGDELAKIDDRHNAAGIDWDWST